MSLALSTRTANATHAFLYLEIITLNCPVFWPMMRQKKSCRRINNLKASPVEMRYVTIFFLPVTQVVKDICGFQKEMIKEILSFPKIEYIRELEETSNL